MDLGKTAFVSLVKQVTNNTTGYTQNYYSSRFSGDQGEVHELPGDCLFTKPGEQIASVNEKVDVRRGWSQELLYS
jgi:hypothetical protein